VSCARPFKVLQMIKSNNHVIKLPLKFNIRFIFDMKELVIYKTRQPISNDHFETLALLALSLARKEYINTTLNAQVIFTRMVNFNESKYMS